MKFTTTEESGVVRIAVEGDVLGGPDARKLNDFVHDLIDENKNRIVLNLSQVELMNSSGLGILISALTTVRRARGDLLLENVTDRLKNLLKVTKLNSVFNVFDSFEEAKAHFLKA